MDLVRPSKIRVLLASNNVELVESIRLLLKESFAIDIIGTASDGNECLKKAVDVKPEVLLVDENIPRTPALEIARQMNSLAPMTSTLILADREDADFLRQVLLTGARDVITTPPTLDQLSFSITHAYELDAPRRRRVSLAAGGEGEYKVLSSRVVAVYGPKGGSGKTVLATNTAVFLAKTQPQGRVALVDLSLQFGDCGLALGLEPPRNIIDLLPVADELNIDYLNNVLVTHTSGLRFLSAPVQPQQAELVGDDAVRKILSALKRYFDYVVVDTSSSLTGATVAALEAADHILFICTPEVFSIRATKSALDLFSELGIAKANISLVLNKISKRLEIKPDEVARLFEDYPVAGSLPDDFVSLQPYINAGMTLAESPRSTPLTNAFKAIANQVVLKTAPKGA